MMKNSQQICLEELERVQQVISLAKQEIQTENQRKIELNLKQLSCDDRPEDFSCFLSWEIFNSKKE